MKPFAGNVGMMALLFVIMIGAWATAPEEGSFATLFIIVSSALLLVSYAIEIGVLYKKRR